MKVERKDIDQLNATIKLTLEKADYEGEFVQELKKYKSKAHIKGFRKGKTPMSSIKKMYGKGVLLEVVNKTLQDKLSGYIVEEKLDILGNPIPSPEQEQLDINVNDLKDYNFSFDVGLAPTIEVKGISAEDEYIDFVISIPDDLLQEELDIRRKRHGKQVHPEDQIVEDDILLFKANELEGDVIKENGWETEFSMMVSRIGLDELKKSILGGKVGDTHDFDIYQLEKDAQESYVKKYLLNLEENEEKEMGNKFRGLIEKITRVEAAELNAEFYEKAFDSTDVASEADAKQSIKEELGRFYEKQQRSYTYRAIMDRLVELNEVELPDEFLKRWLNSNNPEIKPEDIDKEYENFEKNLSWTLIKNNIAKKYELDVKPEEIRESVKNKIMSYMAQYQQGDFDIEPMINNFLNNREQVEKEYEEVLADKLFGEIYKNIKLNKEELTIEEFRDKVQKMNESLNQA